MLIAKMGLKTTVVLLQDAMELPTAKKPGIIPCVHVKILGNCDNNCESACDLTMGTEHEAAKMVKSEDWALSMAKANCSTRGARAKKHLGHFRALPIYHDFAVHVSSYIQTWGRKMGYQCSRRLHMKNENEAHCIVLNELVQNYRAHNMKLIKWCNYLMDKSQMSGHDVK